MSNKQQSQQARTKTTKAKASAASHKYVNCRDTINTIGAYYPAVSQTAPLPTNSNGAGTLFAPLAPMGLGVATLSTTAGVGGSYAPGNVFAPVLRGLFNKAVDFQWYRVTRAKLVFVSNLASTTTGNIVLAGYTDPADVYQTTTNSTISTPSTRTFNLASSAVKELSVPIPVDSSWKRCDGMLSTLGNYSPYVGGNNMIVPVTTANAVCFGAVSVYWYGSTASQTSIGSLYIDYDVEFRSPIDAGVNQ